MSRSVNNFRTKYIFFLQKCIYTGIFPSCWLFVSSLAFRCPALAFHVPSGTWGHEKPERSTVLGKSGSKHKFCLKKLSLRLPSGQNGDTKSQPRIDIYLQYLKKDEKTKNYFKIIEKCMGNPRK